MRTIQINSKLERVLGKLLTYLKSKQQILHLLKLVIKQLKNPYEILSEFNKHFTSIVKQIEKN